MLIRRKSEQLKGRFFFFNVTPNSLWKRIETYQKYKLTQKYYSAMEDNNANSFNSNNSPPPIHDLLQSFEIVNFSFLVKTFKNIFDSQGEHNPTIRIN